jgi:hypothetical protein
MITGIFRTTLIRLLIWEAGLKPAEVTLTSWQQGYTAYLLTLLEGHSEAELLLIILQKEDRQA